MTTGCRRCGNRGHWADACPHNMRAETRKDHEARIAGYVRRMHDGEITLAEKRQMITDENQLWHGTDAAPATARSTK